MWALITLCRVSSPTSKLRTKTMHWHLLGNTGKSTEITPLLLKLTAIMLKVTSSISRTGSSLSKWKNLPHSSIDRWQELRFVDVTCALSRKKTSTGGIHQCWPSSWTRLAKSTIGINHAFQPQRTEKSPKLWRRCAILEFYPMLDLSPLLTRSQSAHTSKTLKRCTKRRSTRSQAACTWSTHCKTIWETSACERKQCSIGKPVMWLPKRRTAERVPKSRSGRILCAKWTWTRHSWSSQAPCVVSGQSLKATCWARPHSLIRNWLNLPRNKNSSMMVWPRKPMRMSWQGWTLTSQRPKARWELNCSRICLKRNHSTWTSSIWLRSPARDNLRV